MEWTTVKNPSSVQPFGSGPQDFGRNRNESVTDFPFFPPSPGGDVEEL